MANKKALVVGGTGPTGPIVVEGLAERGYRLVMNSGADAGQAVAHLHLHILGGGELGPIA